MSDNPNRYDIWDVQSAAGKLITSANSIASHHLTDSMVRLAFGREMAYFAKRIADAVRLGNLLPQDAMQQLVREQHLLLSESRQLQVKALMSAQPELYKAYQPLSLHHVRTAPTLKSDRYRLQRYIGAQQRYIAEQSRPRTPSNTPPQRANNWPPRKPPEPVEYHDPGFYIVPQSTTLDQVEKDLFTSPTPVVLAKFRALNPGIDQLKAGHIVVLSDPANPRCTREEALLMDVAEDIRNKLEDLTPEEADFMMRHREEIEAFLTHGSTSIGIGEAVFSTHLNAVKQLMIDIETLHTNTLARDGHLRSPAFFAERKRLLTQLDSHLTPLTKKGIGFPDHPKLKTALNISSRRLVHRYGRAGGRKQNVGHGTYLQGVAKASNYIKYGGWIGTTLGAGASVMKVQDVCAAGDEEACEKVRYTETGAFVGGVAGGALAGGLLSAGTVAGTCSAIGVASAGIGLLVCGVVVVGTASVAGGLAGSKIGEYSAERIYQVTK